jgi:hypothetical protein
LRFGRLPCTSQALVPGEGMWGRLFGLLAGLALCGESYVLWRPESVGGLPQPDLGPFSEYRLIIAGLAAAAGLAVIVASILREPARKRKTPQKLDFGVEPAPAAPVLQPMFHTPATEPDPELLPVDPFPAAEPAPEPAPAALRADAELAEAHAFAPVAAAQAEAPPPPPPNGAPAERGTFLAAMDAGDQMRAANRLEDALELYDGALTLARRAYGAALGDALARRDLALALTSVADVHDRDGRLDTALSLHEESLRLRRAMAEETPGDLAVQRAYSLGLERLADTREARGHRSRARDLFRERLPLAERLASLAPGDAALTQDLAVTRQRLQEIEAELNPG